MWKKSSTVPNRPFSWRVIDFSVYGNGSWVVVYSILQTKRVESQAAQPWFNVYNPFHVSDVNSCSDVEQGLEEGMQIAVAACG